VTKKKGTKTTTPVGEEVVNVADETIAQEELAENVEMTVEEQLLSTQAEVAENKDLYLRALADLDNYRKRAQREKEDAFRFANDHILRNLIPVLDNLERAIEHAQKSSDEQGNLLQGVEMTLEQLRKVLESSGVTMIESLGLPFDPNFHQAMGQIPTTDQPPNSVVQELQKGYLLNERLLRPAMVMVASAPLEAAVDEIIIESPDDEQSDVNE